MNYITRYTLFWVIVIATKFAFSYTLQVQNWFLMGLPLRVVNSKSCINFKYRVAFRSAYVLLL